MRPPAKGKKWFVAENASWLSGVRPISHLRRDMGCGGAGSDFRDKSPVQLDRRPDRHHRPAGFGRTVARAGRNGYRHELRRHRHQPGDHVRQHCRAGDAAYRLCAGIGRRIDAALGNRQLHGEPRKPARIAGPGAAALIIVALAENSRIPVDNPATHLELTMVHEAMVLEYSGRHLAVIEFAAALKLLLYISLIACLFTPWGIALSGNAPSAYLVGAFSYIGKLAVGGLLLALFETSIAKIRVPRFPTFRHRAHAGPPRRAAPIRLAGF